MRKGSSWLTLLLFVALLGAMAAKNLLEHPPPLRARSSQSQFDARRAMARLAGILADQRPHPADSGPDAALRSRLVASLSQLGLKPIVRDQFACNALFKQRGVSCARVRNVIALLGPSTSEAILLNAHYDSVSAGPGASDDGIGVATLLEVAAILKQRPPRRRVILLFNEGEELGLVGARAFLADPLSRTVASLVNLEARGVRGPVIMFETSRPNARPVDLYAAAVTRPVANSLAAGVYRLMPNYTDVNSFAERGWLTLNLAPIGNETRYHSSGDDIAALDGATLQQMGDQTLALTQKLADGTAPREGGDRIFMDLAAWTLVSLPLPAGAVLLTALLAFFLALSVANRGLARGTSAMLGTIVSSALLTWIGLALIGAMRGGMFWRAEPIWSHLAAYGAAAIAGAALLTSIAKDMDRRQLRSAFWLFFLALGTVTALIAAGAIIFFIFPPILVALGLVLARWWSPAEILGSLAAILLLFLTWGGMLGVAEDLLGNGPMWVFAPLGALLVLPVLIEAKPLLVREGPLRVGAVSGLPWLACWVAAAAAPAYSADRQQRFVIQHVADVAHRASWWSVLNDGAPLPAAYRGSWRRGKLPFSDRTRWIAPAPADSSARAPDVTIVSQSQRGQDRALEIRLRSKGNENIALIAPDDAKIRTAGAAGFIRPIDQKKTGKFTIGCFGASCDGIRLQLTLRQLKPVQFIVVGSRIPLPESAAALVAGRPRFARPQYQRDESIAFEMRTL